MRPHPATPRSRSFLGLSAAAALGLSLVTAGSVRAGAFALTEHNAVGLGVGYSSAAVAADASTTYFNPAGLVHLDRPQVVAAVHWINFEAEYADAGSTTAGAFPIGGGNGGSAGAREIIPNLYYAQPLGPSFAFGIGLSAPWGLETDYADGWVGRYHALKTRLESANLNPGFAWRITDAVSFGLGVSAQRLKAEIGNAIDFGLAGFSLGIPGFLPGGADGKVAISGDSVKYGWNVGFLFEPAPGTRWGVHYRSQIRHDIEGDAVFSGVPAPFAAAFPNQPASARLTVPEIWSAHVMQSFAQDWMVTADISWFGWSSVQSLDVDFENAATPDSSLPQRWDDAAIYSFGVHWQASDALTVRAGFVYNESPVSEPTLRSPRIPDSNRRWITAGFSWQPRAGLAVHAGYARVIFADAPIDFTDAFTHRLRGSADLSADVVSVQGTWEF